MSGIKTLLLLAFLSVPVYSGCNDNDAKKTTPNETEAAGKTGTNMGTNVLSSQEIKELLTNYHRDIKSSFIPISSATDEASPEFGNQYGSAIAALTKAKPTPQLIELFQKRDPSVMNLGGTFFGRLCEKTGSEAYLEELAAALDDKNAAVRSFACEALGELTTDKVVPLLKTCLNDGAVVPGQFGGQVNFAAACGLARNKNADGFPVMLKWAEQNPDYWQGSLLGHFQNFSTNDFASDLEAWLNHFSNHPAKWVDK